MTNDEALALITDALGHVAPELDLDTVDPQAELTVEADLDSMDFLNVVGRISDVLGWDIPERDYPRLVSLASFVAYLTEVTDPIGPRG
jgi:acyl carrier protein